VEFLHAGGTGNPRHSLALPPGCPGRHSRGGAQPPARGRVLVPWGTGCKPHVIAQETGSGRVISELACLSAALKPWTDVPAAAGFRDALAGLLPLRR
jgi:hypothetical protein